MIPFQRVSTDRKLPGEKNEETESKAAFTEIVSEFPARQTHEPTVSFIKKNLLKNDLSLLFFHAECKS